MPLLRKILPHNACLVTYYHSYMNFPSMLELILKAYQFFRLITPKSIVIVWFQKDVIQNEHNNWTRKQSRDYKRQTWLRRQTHASQRAAITFTVADKMSLRHKETIMEIWYVLTQRIAQTVTVHILQEWISVFVDCTRIIIAARNYISFARRAVR